MFDKVFLSVEALYVRTSCGPDNTHHVQYQKMVQIKWKFYAKT
jgi:hypothetical protein